MFDAFSVDFAKDFGAGGTYFPASFGARLVLLSALIKLLGTFCMM